MSHCRVSAEVCCRVEHQQPELLPSTETAECCSEELSPSRACQVTWYPVHHWRIDSVHRWGLCPVAFACLEGGGRVSASTFLSHCSIWARDASPCPCCLCFYREIRHPFFKAGSEPQCQSVWNQSSCLLMALTTTTPQQHWGLMSAVIILGAFWFILYQFWHVKLFCVWYSFELMQQTKTTRKHWIRVHDTLTDIPFICFFHLLSHMDWLFISAFHSSPIPLAVSLIR